MAKNYKNFVKGIAIIPKGAPESNLPGELETLTDGKLYYRNNVDSSAVVTASHSATLTNKTIDLTNNTLIATSAQLASAVTDETGSGLLVFNTAPSLNAGAPLTTTSTQLNYLKDLPSVSGTTGFTNSQLVFSNTPTLTTPQINAINVNGTYTLTLPITAPGTSQSLVHTGSNVYEWKETNKAPNFIKFTSNGNYIASSNVKYIRIRMVGGGGGGGGSIGSGDRSGGGGGSGAYVEAIILSPSGTYNITVGNGGNGGILGANGSNGNESRFIGDGGAWQIIANGGSGGKAGSNSAGFYGAGGLGGSVLALPAPIGVTISGFCAPGQGGCGGGVDDLNGDNGGAGGSSLLGGGANSSGVGTAGAAATANSGGGGSGGGCTGVGGFVGGAGGSGLVIIEEYFNY